MSKVFVICGPDGVGKGTVVSNLMARYPDLFLSISMTTRPPRTGETNGIHYHFVDDKKFDELVNNDGLLEWALVHKKYRYGTPRGPIEKAVADGNIALLEIDLQGARQVRKTMPDAFQIFLAPPSWDELVSRLAGRGTESAEEQARRLQSAKTELAAADEFDAVVVNDEIDRTVDQLVELMGLPTAADY